MRPVGTGDATGSGSADATANAEVGSASADDATATADETGDPVDDPCLAADPSACPDDCSRGSAWQVIDDACTTSGIELCIPGGPKPGVPATTYWATHAWGPVFVEYGGSCSAAAQPAGWRECSGAPDEPADCACFCRQGVCPGDEDRVALEQCGVDPPCPAVLVDPQFGVTDHQAAICMLEALRDRITGVYEIISADSFGMKLLRLYVAGDEVQRVVMETDDIVMCPHTTDWGGAQRCALQPSEFFASCLELSGTPDDCALTPEDWVLDCVALAPSCD